MSQKQKQLEEKVETSEIQYSLCVEQEMAKEAALGALGVVAGVITKNTFEQMGQPDHIGSKLVGPALFLAGWVQTAKVLAEKDEDGNIMRTPQTYMAIGACASIAVSVMIIKKSMADGVPVPAFAKPMFAVGWLMVGYLSSDNNANKLAYLIPAFVMLSMKLLMPYQRANGIVDGPGLPLFMVAWLLFIYVNSKV